MIYRFESSPKSPQQTLSQTITMKSFVSIWILLLLGLQSSIDVRSSLAFTTTTSIGVVSTLKQRSTYHYAPISIHPQRYESRVVVTITTTPTLVLMESSNRPQHSTTESHILDDSSNEYIADTFSSSSSSSLQPLTTKTTTTTTTVLGPTELLLLQRHQMRQQGLRQEYGCTIKNDPYDYIRSVIWLLFKISNVIFPTLGVGLTIGLGLNLFCGLGYYYDTTSHTIVIDTLEHLRFQNQFLNSL